MFSGLLKRVSLTAVSCSLTIIPDPSASKLLTVSVLRHYKPMLTVVDPSQRLGLRLGAS